MSMKEFYKTEVAPALMTQFGYKNVMQVPRLQKIVLNMGVGDATQNRKILDEAVSTLTAITGQKAVVTKAKTAISNFKLREGLGIGAKVTLHGDNMWDFLYRFINIALPRVRDFREFPVADSMVKATIQWVSKSRLSLLKLISTKISHTLGMDISFVTSAKNDDEGRALLEALGLPYRK
jgi:large subunit ribosomal protein L5